VKIQPATLFAAASITLSPLASGQTIPNPSFEEAVVPVGEAFMTPVSPGYAELIPVIQWAFGMPGGICRQSVAYAEQLQAPDGAQVAFIQGDPSSDMDFPIKSIMGVDITGLVPGKNYEISWQQTGRATDLGNCAIAATLAASNFPTIVLFGREPVETKGAWQRMSAEFLAPTDTLRLNIQHTITEPGNMEPGSESTLFDDFQIKALD
jgi:hypothetical protein